MTVTEEGKLGPSKMLLNWLIMMTKEATWIMLSWTWQNWHKSDHAGISKNG